MEARQFSLPQHLAAQCSDKILMHINRPSNFQQTIDYSFEVFLLISSYLLLQVFFLSICNFFICLLVYIVIYPICWLFFKSLFVDYTYESRVSGFFTWALHGCNSCCRRWGEDKDSWVSTECCKSFLV